MVRIGIGLKLLLLIVDIRFASDDIDKRFDPDDDDDDTDDDEGVIGFLVLLL